MVVTVLVAAMVPMLGVTLPEHTAQVDRHADWLRSHVSQHVPSSAQTAIDAALREAAEDAPGSLRAFTHAFATAYEQQVASSHAAADALDGARLPSLGSLFAATDVDAATLFSHLRYRALQGTPPAVLPRFQATPTAPLPTSGSSRIAGVLPSQTVPSLHASRLSSPAPTATIAVRAGLLATLWSALPLGP
jgi:hypothetical protein